MPRFIFEVFRPNELRLCIFVEKKLLTNFAKSNAGQAGGPIVGGPGGRDAEVHF
jgi:hypothetical protein